jgi:putative hydrolase of the HAD superfamily
MNNARPGETGAVPPAQQAVMSAPVAGLARRHAPRLLCDRKEPFRPVMLGVTILAPGEGSPSTRHVPTGPETTQTIIEYAIWWDGDIEHLYELEHVWVFVDAEGEMVHVAASAHGGIFDMACEKDGARPVLYCEPGKHAHAGSAGTLAADRSRTDRACLDQPGLSGILVNDIFAEALGFLAPYDHFLAREHLKAQRFTPDYAFTREFDLAHLPMLSWPELRARIPRSLRDQLEGLRAARRGVKAVFVDSGDTLIDEGSQVFEAGEPDLVLSAQAIAGAARLIAEIKARGYLLALVADGREESFVNVHTQLGLWESFDVRAISEIAGFLKPHPALFREAMAKLGLRETDAGGVVFFGNNLKRDIRGGNELGMTTVWLDWVDRYDKKPDGQIEQPDYVVKAPYDLLDVIERLERDAGNSPAAS